MAADGSGQTRLTFNASNEFCPDWSPDGTKIAFVSNRDGNDEIYTMSADGSDVMRITEHAANDWLPSWSADGTEILFASNRDGETLDVYAVALDSLAVRRLTAGSGYNYEPAWRR